MVNKQNVDEIINIPSSNKGVPYLWNINVQVMTQGNLTRLSSRNHNVDIKLSENKSSATITLNESEKNITPQKDFVLLIRDTNINTPTAFYSTNANGETAVSLNILADIRDPKILQKKGKKTVEDGLDTDPH